METHSKKIRMLLLLCLVMMILESIIGVATLYTGLMYRKFDREKALEMIEIVKKTDPNLYEKIINPDDRTYLEEFESSYTEKRHTMLIIYGGIITLFSFGCLIPLAILFMPFIGKKDGSEETEEKKEKEPPEDEF